jgi:predicted dehydrogenase
MIKLSIIGSGRWGQVLIKKFHSLCGVHGVYGHQHRESLQESLGVRFVEDVDELIADSEAVVVATPAPTHYDVARRVLDAGKDLFLEKPMALRVDEAEDLVSRAARGSRVLMLGHILCYGALAEQLRALGRPVRAEGVFHKESTTEKFLNATWNFGPHLVALADFLGVPPEALTLDCHDQAPREQRTFTLTAVDEAGGERTLTADYLSSGAKEDRLEVECQHFLECVRTRATPRTDGPHGVRVIETLTRLCPDVRQ